METLEQAVEEWPLLPDWSVAQWFNTEAPLSLSDLRGRVVMLFSFQMLCPGCVAEALPQAKRLRETFREDHLAVIGLHTVFEHHEAMGPAALAAFIHEYRLAFPIGVDLARKDNPVPETMARYGLRGTPSILLVDRAGRLRRHHFGHLPDLKLGAAVSRLLAEHPASPERPPQSAAEPLARRCEDGVCTV